MEDNGSRIQGLSEAIRNASRAKNVVGECGGEDLRSADLSALRYGLLVQEPMGCPGD